MITPSYNITATERVLPKLALDFTTALLDPRVTFARSGATATCVNSSGNVAVVAANVPRFDYNPSTLECKGLLIEELRTNNFTYSQDFRNAIWTPNRCGLNANATTSPDGTNNALSLIEDSTASNTHYFYYATTSGWTAGAYTMSVYIKAKSNDRRVTLYQAFGGVAGSYVTFDPTSGTVAGTGGSATGTMTAAGNGWYRCTISYTTTSTTARFDIALNTASGVGFEAYTGNGTSGIYIWGAQLEVGAFATSYIPTTTTALTRNADVATMTGTNFSDWFNASEGSIVSTATQYASLINNDVVWQLYTIVSSVENTLVCNQNYSTTGRVRLLGYTGVTNDVNIYPATVYSATEKIKIAVGYKENNYGLAVNGSAAQTDLSGSVPPVIAMSLGCNVAQTSSYMNGWLQQLNYYPQRLTDAELQAFSK